MARDVIAERTEIDRAVEGRTVCRQFQETATENAGKEALRWKRGDGWQSWTWNDYAARVRDGANGLASLGFRPGDFANILSGNRAEYYAADLGVLHAGGTPVSLYNTLAPEQIEYIVNHCEATIVFAENAAYYERLRSIRARIPKVRKVVLFEGAEGLRDDDWILSFDALLESGRAYGTSHPEEIEGRVHAVRPDALCTLIYTSGTTGPPKGVEITHRNVLWTAESLLRAMPIEQGSRQISYLPLAHIAERLTGYYMPMFTASVVHFCPNPQEIGNYLADVRPNFFFAVPRIWEKLHERLTAALESRPEAERDMAKAALGDCRKKLRLEQEGKPVPADLAAAVEQAQPLTALVRQRVGLDEVQVASTGAAPISLEVLEFFHAIGVPIAEVYGQSEDTGPTSWNRIDRIRLGTVVPSVPGVEVKLAPDGELLVRGGNVTRGYYKEPALTRETFDEDGWLHSGDVATIDDEGFIRIVDRKKEILITAGGKNIAPSNIEGLLKQKPLIGQACVIGDRRPYCSALLVLEREAAAAWAKAHGIEPDVDALARNQKLIAEIQSAVDEVNTHLHNQEQVRKFTLLAREWTTESGELTPTLKMKRKVVNEKYGSEIEGMYASKRANE